MGQFNANNDGNDLYSWVLVHSQHQNSEIMTILPKNVRERVQLKTDEKVLFWLMKHFYEVWRFKLRTPCISLIRYGDFPEERNHLVSISVFLGMMWQRDNKWRTLSVLLMSVWPGLSPSTLADSPYTVDEWIIKGARNAVHGRVGGMGCLETLKNWWFGEKSSSPTVPKAMMHRRMRTLQKLPILEARFQRSRARRSFQ